MKDLLKELRSIKSEKRDIERFGLGGLYFFGFFFFCGLIFVHKLSWKLFVLAIAFYLLGKFLPSVLKWIYFPMIIFGLIMGHIVSTVALTILYFLCITPIALIARLTGKKFLDLSFRNEADSYWNLRQKKEKTENSCETQY